MKRQSSLNGTCLDSIHLGKFAMCGRFVSARKRLELLEEFSIERDHVADGPEPEPTPDYNVAPTRRVFAVMEPRPRDEKRDKERDKERDGELDGKRDEEPAGPPPRELRVVRWGLIPFWAKDASGGGKLINARAETVAVKPALRRALTTP